MSILSNVFNGGDTDSTTHSDLLSDVTGALSTDFSHESADQSVDEDGSSETSYDSSHFGTDLDFGSMLDGVLHNVTDGDGASI